MEDQNTLQARRQAQAMKGRSAAPGSIMSTGPTASGTFGPSGSGAFAPATGPTQIGGGGAPASTTGISFSSPAFGTANAHGFSSTPQNTPPVASPAGGAGLVSSPSFGAPQPVAGTPPSTPPIATTNAPAQQLQMTNAQRIASQLQSYGIADMVMPGANNANGRPQQFGENASTLGADVQGADPTKSRKAQTVPTDVREFIRFIPRHGLMQCTIKREKSFGFGGGAKYRLYHGKDKRFLLSSRKRSNKPTSNYLISLDENDMERASSSFLGKVRANFTGLEFVIYDNGENPGSGKTPVRQEFGAVMFQSNIAGVKGPRKLHAVLPMVKDDETADSWQPMNDEESLLAEYKRDPQSPRLITLQNKAPTWNEQLRAYQLNFHGRVTVPSVKNFQLCDSRNPSRVVLQFGKCNDNEYSLDYQYPLNAYQAFAIAMTSFDNKLACD